MWRTRVYYMVYRQIYLFAYKMCIIMAQGRGEGATAWGQLQTICLTSIDPRATLRIDSSVAQTITQLHVFDCSSPLRKKGLYPGGYTTLEYFAFWLIAASYSAQIEWPTAPTSQSTSRRKPGPP